ncbi:hypothetical protein DUNSADRAFT_5649 [Dunaliella salina]|uniref:Uncharacterized protein n=1 Tax=Dunaliella salina TaxID=3046 RepID=A0ABQ7FU64_DUNSA|nr:hypothetical protein DUNSADRAFT_5649 [Dunaliella salina]|eukprot:KAF5825960.1 hypothetical protein DUNSADRAFT_5649 [Dunaliella salina]
MSSSLHILTRVLCQDWLVFESGQAMNDGLLDSPFDIRLPKVEGYRREVQICVLMAFRNRGLLRPKWSNISHMAETRKVVVSKSEIKRCCATFTWRHGLSDACLSSSACTRCLAKAGIHACMSSGPNSMCARAAAAAAAKGREKSGRALQCVLELVTQVMFSLCVQDTWALENSHWHAAHEAFLQTQKETNEHMKDGVLTRLTQGQSPLSPAYIRDTKNGNPVWRFMVPEGWLVGGYLSPFSLDRERIYPVWRFMVPEGAPEAAAPRGLGDGAYTPLKGARRVVAVVGTAHVKGIVREWSQAVEEEGGVDQQEKRWPRTVAQLLQC